VIDERVAIFPPKGSNLGLQSFSREVVEAAWDSISPPDFASGPLPRGDGQTVLLIPGFLAGDWTMARLRTFLVGLGYRVETARVFFNPGPTSGMIAQLDAALLRLAKSGKISIIGQSLGGVLARSLAQRYPHCVRRVVTMCSPIRFPVTTPLEPFAQMLSPFHDAKWVARRHEIAQSVPVPVTAIYSIDDGIVDWRQCVQDEAPGCENVCVRGAHTVMGSNPQAQAAIAFALARD
jgi:predicted esterase YcpF (UPF0227 family)